MKRVLRYVGNLTGVSGNLTGVRGDLTRISGNLSGVTGDLDACEITPANRQQGVSVADLIGADDLPPVSLVPAGDP